MKYDTYQLSTNKISLASRKLQPSLPSRIPIDIETNSIDSHRCKANFPRNSRAVVAARPEDRRRRSGLWQSKYISDKPGSMRFRGSLLHRRRSALPPHVIPAALSPPGNPSVAAGQFGVSPTGPHIYGGAPIGRPRARRRPGLRARAAEPRRVLGTGAPWGLLLVRSRADDVQGKPRYSRAPA